MRGLTRGACALDINMRGIERDAETETETFGGFRLHVPIRPPCPALADGWQQWPPAELSRTLAMFDAVGSRLERNGFAADARRAWNNARQIREHLRGVERLDGL